MTPSLSLGTIGPARSEGKTYAPPPMIFRGMGSLTYMEFFGPAAIQQQRNVSANVRAELTIAPQRPFGVYTFAGYTRVILPNVAGNPDLSFNQNRIDAGLDTVFTPGGGTLEYRAGYTLGATLYESAGASQFTNLLHTGTVRGRWRFNPRNSLFSEASVGRLQYTSLKAGSQLVDATPIAGRIGFDGLFTPMLGATVSAGWASTFFDKRVGATAQDFDSFVASARITYYLTPNPDADDAASKLSTFVGTISGGYARTFQYSLLTNQYTMDRGDLALNMFFAGRAAVTLGGGVAAVTYPTFVQYNLAGNTDIRPDVNAFAEYRITDSIGVNVTARYSQNISKIRLPQDAAATQFFDFNWQRFEAFLGARWFM